MFRYVTRQQLNAACCGNVGTPVLFSAMLAIIESAAEMRVLANSLFQLVYIIL